MSVGLNIEFSQQDPFVIIHLEGRLDATTSPVLEKQLADQLQVKGAKLIIDFTQVDYLSSAGMRLLLSISKKAKANESKIAFCCINDEVMEIIKMAGFERILSIFSSQEDAKANLS